MDFMMNGGNEIENRDEISSALESWAKCYGVSGYVVAVLKMY